MNEQTLKTLQESKDPRALKNGAFDCASSKVPKDIEALGGFLMSADFLERLDSPQDYQTTIARLRLSRVMQALMDNRIAASDQLLLRLTKSDVFQAEVLRMQLLIRALVPIKPSPRDAIAYWDGVSQPGSPLAADVVEALCINQSSPAMTLLEQKFTNPAEQADQKIAWMQQLILPRRNDEPLLKCCERILTAGQPKDAQVELVEVLFDYRPEKWYRGCEAPKPPLRPLATSAAKEVMRRIAEFGLNKMTLPPDLQVKVKSELETLGGKNQDSARPG
jgi:hypothetical protein